MSRQQPLREARADLVRTRVIEGAVALLEEGRPLTFKAVAHQAGVPERTVYRYFPSRAELVAALFERTNERIGHDRARPTTADALVELLHRAFQGFDDHAAVVRRMLIEPEGRDARLADVADRRRAAIELVDHEVPDLDRVTRDRLAAVIQILTTASTWQGLHDYWDLAGPEAAETSALAIELLLEAARGRARRTTH